MLHTESAAGADRPHPNLFGMDRAELRSALSPWTDRPYHADQIFHWLYGRRENRLSSMSDLPLRLRDALTRRYRIEWPVIRESRRSTDGSRKYVLALDDGFEIEAVFILYGSRVTLCLSSQVGCPLACRFCLTGKMGLLRNMTPGEIAGQVAVLAADNGVDPMALRVVFMGMGEPLNNYDAVMSAFRLLVDPRGFGIPPRRITLSTAGLVPGIDRLAKETPRPRLAVSLAAAHDDLRNELIPINRKFDLESLMDACRRFPLAPRERVTFEYVLLAGINDRARDAGRIAGLIRGMRAKVNLIPYNEVGACGYTTPSPERATRFREALMSRGVSSTIRWSKGRDISAACGQLARGDAAVMPAGGSIDA